MTTMTAAAKVHRRQQDYIDAIIADGFDFGLTVAEAFVNSMRDLGYKSTATALDELIDNSLEAGAENVHVAFGYGKSQAKPEEIAVLDDGYGMLPAMIRASVVWGGTDREDSRNLFGRYGYGLPSASISQGRRLTVYSRPDAGAFHAVDLDIDEIRSGKYMINQQFVVPESATAQLPPWVTSYAKENFPGGPAALRTVVLWSKLDRLTWKTATKLEVELLQHFGLAYRNYLRQTRIVVNGKTAEPVDPLFTTPGYRFYDFGGQRANALPSLEFVVKDDSGKPAGTCRLRVSYMPPGFLSKDKTKKATPQNANARFNIRKDNRGLIVCRNGRQIDVVTRTPLTTFVNNDSYIGLELDFPAALDEKFGVTTAKQQITISASIWDHMREAGFLRILRDLRARYNEDKADAESGLEKDPTVARNSEAVMTQVKDLIRRRPQSEESSVEAQENLQREIDRIARQKGIGQDAAGQQKAKEIEDRPFKILLEDVADAPFYRVEQQGGQLVLFLNKGHHFYTDVYNLVEGAEGVRVRAALELLLFVLGQCELDAPNVGRAWYQSERLEWSRRLNAALTVLDDQIDLVTEDPND